MGGGGGGGKMAIEKINLKGFLSVQQGKSILKLSSVFGVSVIKRLET